MAEQSTPEENGQSDGYAHLIPLNGLSREHRDELVGKAKLLSLDTGERLEGFAPPTDHAIYLLDGEIELYSDKNASGRISATDDSANFPIGAPYQQSVTAIQAISRARLLRVNRTRLSMMLTLAQYASDSSLSAAEGQSGWTARMLGSGLFSRVPSANIFTIFHRMEPVTVKAGEAIIRQGEEGDYYFVIHRGRAEVTRSIDPGQEDATLMQLAKLGPGDSFGEEALVAEATRNANVSMLTDGLLMRLTKEDFVALIREPLLQTVNRQEAEDMVKNGARWMDVRLNEEYDQNGLPGSLHIALSEIRQAAEKLEPDCPYIAYCNSGKRSAAATFLLTQKGFDIYLLEGGLLGQDIPFPESAGKEPEQVIESIEENLRNAHEEVESALQQQAEITTSPAATRTAATRKESAALAAASALARAQKNKLRLETALRNAEAEAARRRAEAEATCHQLRAQVEQRLQADEANLEKEYAHATEELEKLGRARKTTEVWLKKQRERVETEWKQRSKTLEDKAQQIEETLDSARQHAEEEARRIRDEEAAEEKRLKAETETKLRTERAHLEEEFATSMKELTRAQRDLEHAEAARELVHEKASRLSEELRESRQDTGRKGPSKTDAPAVKKPDSPAVTIAPQSPASQVQEKKPPISPPKQAQEAQQAVVEEELRLQLYQEAEQWLSEEHSRSKNALAKAQEAVNKLRARNARTVARKQKDDLSLLNEVSALLEENDDSLNTAEGDRAYAEEKTNLAQAAMADTRSDREQSEDALARARAHISRLQEDRHDHGGKPE